MLDYRLEGAESSGRNAIVYQGKIGAIAVRVACLGKLCAVPVRATEGG